jgi:hypothetical protein
MLPPTLVGEKIHRLPDVFRGRGNLYLLYQEAVTWSLEILSDLVNDRRRSQQANGSASYCSIPALSLARSETALE